MTKTRRDDKPGGDSEHFPEGPTFLSSGLPGGGQTKHRSSRLLASYIGAEILKTSLLVFLILELVHGSILTIQAVRGHGFDLVLLFPIFWRIFAYAIYHSMPIALLFGTCLVFGRLIADQEILAARSFGISHLQILTAPLALGLFFATVGFFINGHLVPELRFTKRNIGKLFLDQLQYIGDGWNKRISISRESLVHIGHHSGGVLYDLVILAENPGKLGLGALAEQLDEELGPRSAEAAPNTPAERPAGDLENILSFPFVLHAAEGAVVSAEHIGATTEVADFYLELRGVDIYLQQRFFESSSKSRFLNHIAFETLPIPIMLDDRKRSVKDMPNPMLVREIRTRQQIYEESYEELQASDSAAARQAQRNYRSARSEYHRRLAYAGISLFFPLTAALLALALNSANRLLPFFIGVILNCAVFFPLEMHGRELGRSLGNPWFFGQLGNLALLLVSLGLFVWLERLPPFRRRTPPGKRREEAR